MGQYSTNVDLTLKELAMVQYGLQSLMGIVVVDAPDLYSLSNRIEQYIYDVIHKEREGK